VVCTGGAYDRSPLWHAAIADALGRPIVSAPFDETSLRGVASLAWNRVDVLNREGSLSRLGEC
jgi:sugar (pentulose or hexulose) kinase